MESLLEVIKLAAYSVGAAALFSFVLLVFAYRRNERKVKSRIERTRHDISDMVILFQTMRDIIAQQKNLARDFNAELERKMALVKQILAQGMEKNERLYEKQQTLAQQLEETQSTLQSLQRQVAYLRESLPDKTEAPEEAAAARAETPPPKEAAPEPQEAPAPEPPEESAGADTDPERAVLAALSRLTSITPLEEPNLSDLLGLRNQPIEVDESIDDTPPPALHPEDPEAAREAFRALLNMPATPPEPGKSDTKPPETAASEAHPGGNGGPSMTVLRERVSEYSAAGMSVPEIARELGLGKGEVRLMLSLNKPAKRP